MVAQAALEQRDQQMRLGISDAEIAHRITTNPSFQNDQGQFDRAKFEELLRNAGFTEQRFVSEQRGLLLRRQITDSIVGNLPVPKAWLTAINQYQGETRSIDYVALTAAQAGDIPQPTAEELAKYFDERKIMFRAPEYRKIVTVAATPAELGKTVEVSDDEVKKAFDENRSRYITPEKRHIEQMVFPTMAEAEAASAKIKAGTTFAQLATERGLKEQDLDLGTVTKTTLIDPAVADAAFALKDGEVSEPVQGRFGVVIVTVTQIIPEEDKSFADVAPQIRNDIATARAKQQIQDIHDKVEDARAGGATLEEAAEKLKLPVVTIDSVDRSGRDPAGKEVNNVPDAAQLINAAFSSDIGVDNDPLEFDGGYIWYDVTGITPARDRKLDEVKSEVETRWRDDQVAARLKSKSAEMLDKLKTGNAFDAVAAADGLQIQKASDIKRGQGSPSLSSRAVEAVFHTAKDGFGTAQGQAASDWIVFHVTDDQIPPLDPNSNAAKQIEQSVQRQMGDDLFGQYMAWLEDYLGTTVNQTALAQALGNGNGAPDTN
jgi:peptidyl-prolyl cis-trans isomerase D